MTATYGTPVGLRSFAAAEVAESPCSVSEHAQLPAVTQQRQKRWECSSRQHKVSALRAITRNIAKRPNGLLSDIRFMAAQKLDEDWDGTGLNDNLCLLCGARRNVGKSPGRFELDERVRRA